MPHDILLDDITGSVPIYTQDDFVFCKKTNGDITSCGFRIDSTLMKRNQSPFVTYTTSNNHVDNTSQVADIFRNKTVPMGIYYAPTKSDRYHADIEEEDTTLEIDDDLYEKLLGLVDASTMSRKKNLTKKTKRTTTHRKTKSNRNTV